MSYLEDAIFSIDLNEDIHENNINDFDKYYGGSPEKRPQGKPPVKPPKIPPIKPPRINLISSRAERRAAAEEEEKENNLHDLPPPPPSPIKAAPLKKNKDKTNEDRPPSPTNPPTNRNPPHPMAPSPMAAPPIASAIPVYKLQEGHTIDPITLKDIEIIFNNEKIEYSKSEKNQSEETSDIRLKIESYLDTLEKIFKNLIYAKTIGNTQTLKYRKLDKNRSEYEQQIEKVRSEAPDTEEKKKVTSEYGTYDANVKKTRKEVDKYKEEKLKYLKELLEERLESLKKILEERKIFFGRKDLKQWHNDPYEKERKKYIKILNLVNDFFNELEKPDNLYLILLNLKDLPQDKHELKEVYDKIKKEYSEKEYSELENRQNYFTGEIYETLNEELEKKAEQATEYYKKVVTEPRSALARSGLGINKNKIGLFVKNQKRREQEQLEEKNRREQEQLKEKNRREQEQLELLRNISATVIANVNHLLKTKKNENAARSNELQLLSDAVFGNIDKLLTVHPEDEKAVVSKDLQAISDAVFGNIDKLLAGNDEVENAARSNELQAISVAVFGNIDKLLTGHREDENTPSPNELQAISVAVFDNIDKLLTGHREDEKAVVSKELQAISTLVFNNIKELEKTREKIFKEREKKLNNDVEYLLELLRDKVIKTIKDEYIEHEPYELLKKSDISAIKKKLIAKEKKFKNDNLNDANMDMDTYIHKYNLFKTRLIYNLHKNDKDSVESKFRNKVLDI